MILILAVSLILHLVIISGKKWAKTATQKFEMSLSFPAFPRQSRPCFHVPSVKNEKLECEIKESLGYYSEFYWHHTWKFY